MSEGKEKTNDELIREFLENGGEIEKLPPEEPEEDQTIGSISKKTPELMSLAEGELMFGEKNKRKKKKKPLPDIDTSLIPEHLHHIVKNNEEENDKSSGEKKT